MKSIHFTTEATSVSDRVINNGPTLMEILMNKNLWVEMFPCIIGKNIYR
ncbi:hypothetical protein RDI58_015253 [Solanum bulbocastanum]|uniref:Uncharacterized protein n=1 Tax=Solanum bulbocastanum TaxID=147425 RepID=A0AAN8TL91_SOLBU